MVKKSVVILGILALLLVSAGMSWGYTVCKWPPPGIPNVVYPGDAACLAGRANTVLRGPVAPSCRPPLVPGLIHGALSIPFRALAVAATPLFTQRHGRVEDCCPCPLGDPAFVTAAVPCTPVHSYVPPRRW
jgi:hypothetical protein